MSLLSKLTMANTGHPWIRVDTRDKHCDNALEDSNRAVWQHFMMQGATEKHVGKNLPRGSASTGGKANFTGPDVSEPARCRH